MHQGPDVHVGPAVHSGEFVQNCPAVQLLPCVQNWLPVQLPCAVQSVEPVHCPAVHSSPKVQSGVSVQGTGPNVWSSNAVFDEPPLSAVGLPTFQTRAAIPFAERSEMCWKSGESSISESNLAEAVPVSTVTAAASARPLHMQRAIQFVRLVMSFYLPLRQEGRSRLRNGACGRHHLLHLP